MAQRLTNDAKTFILSQNQIMSDVADELGIGVLSIPQYIGRDSKRLVEFKVLTLIAKAMEKEPEEIIEEIPKQVVETK